MHYEIRVDFGDHAVHAPKECRTLEDINEYLSSIPNMIAFQLKGQASVTIKRIPNLNQNILPGLVPERQ